MKHKAILQSVFSALAVAICFGIIESTSTICSYLAHGEEVKGNGAIKGVALDKNSGNPVSGVGIILGKMVENEKYALQSDLITVTDGHGRFYYASIPTGTYIVFYNRVGPKREIWGNLDGHIVIIRVRKNLINQKGKWDMQFIESLGGDVAMKKGATLKIEDGKSSVSCASFFSRKYHLEVNYPEDNPVWTNVLPDEKVSLELKVWD
ncbi:MAG: hypothetical protein JRK53_03705 [Deltaproteobacteria bacterium]|nr:hypothetical protein [Deltaproteobacteria bacterium]